MSNSSLATIENQPPLVLCQLNDLVPNSGICVLANDTQIALFYLPDESPAIYALSNWDPIGKANVLSRGIVGDIDGKLVVASPLYKHHFGLDSGQCFEEADITIAKFSVAIEGDSIVLVP